MFDSDRANLKSVREAVIQVLQEFEFFVGDYEPGSPYEGGILSVISFDLANVASKIERYIEQYEV